MSKGKEITASIIMFILVLLGAVIGIYLELYRKQSEKKDTVFEVSGEEKFRVERGVLKGKIAPPSVTEIAQIWIGLDVEGKGVVEMKGRADNMKNVFELAHIVAKNMRWKVRSVLFDIRPMSTPEFIQAHDYAELLLKCL
jgi:hypothetical protein